MQNYLPLTIGLRYLKSKRSNAFISFVSVFALLGMALGVFALIVVLSVMNGFDRELKERILRTVAHGHINVDTDSRSAESLMAELHGQPGVVGSAPFVKTNGLLTYAGSARGVEILGVDPVFEPAVSSVHAYMSQGTLSALKPGQYQVLMGGLLARFMGVGVGDTVTLTLPEIAMTPAGAFPRARSFTVAGLYDTGAQSDQTGVLIHIRDAQKLLRLGQGVHGLRLKTADIYQAPAILENLTSILPAEATIADWSSSQGHLFQAVKMEKTVVGFLLGIIIAVAAFNIVTSLIMMIAEKRSDIAVLRTMGMRARQIVALFLVQGVTLGVVGILAGVALGVAGALTISEIVAWFEQVLGLQVFDPTVYFVTRLPSELRSGDVLRVVLGAGVITFIASAYPAWRASQIAPAEALRYNT